MKITIIGAGLAGMITAIECKRLNPTLQVMLIEKNPKIGRKLLSTGNGRANLSNLLIGQYLPPTIYNDIRIARIVKEYDVEYLIDYYRNLGLCTVAEHARIYPKSKMANTVVDILRFQIERLNIEVIVDTAVNDFYYQDDKWQVITEQSKIETDILVLTSGGLATSAMGNDRSISSILERMNVKINPFRPGLVPLKTDLSLKSIAGIKVEVQVKYKLHRDFGEMLFKDNALSGIVSMNLASAISRSGLTKDQVQINFLPGMTSTQFEKLYKKGEMLLPSNPLIGILPKMLGLFLIKQIGQMPLKGLYQTLTNFPLDVTVSDNWNQAQVSVGGVELDQLDSFKLKDYSNIYIGGELVDGDGLCGGYNLHFAAISGIIIANDINGIKMLDNKTHNGRFNLRIFRKQNWQVQDLFIFMQTIGSEHFSILGVGRKFLKEKDLSWIILDNQIEIQEYQTCQEIKVESFISKIKAGIVTRYCKFFTEEDKLIGVGISHWGVYDRQTTHLTKEFNIKTHIKEEDIITSPFENLKEEFTQLESTDKKITTILVEKKDLDYNNHVNNTVYIRWIEEIIGRISGGYGEIKYLKINYLAQLFLNDKVTITCQTYPDYYLFEGQRVRDGVIAFTAQVQF